MTDSVVQAEIDRMMESLDGELTQPFHEWSMGFLTSAPHRATT